MRYGLLILSLAYTCNSAFGSLPISILDQRHSTEVSITRWMGYDYATTTNYSRSLTSFDFIADSVDNSQTGLLAAKAKAGLFGTYGSALSPMGLDGLIVGSKAIATSELWFSPIRSETASLSMSLSASGHFWDCSAWTFSLLNVTTGEELWNHQWLGDWTGGVLLYGTPASDFTSALIALDTDFVATDIYKLTMHTETYAGDSPRSPTVSFQLTGLETITTVPEPSALSLFGLGALACLVRRRR